MNNVVQSVINEYKLSSSFDGKDICNRVIKFINNHLINTVASISQNILLYQMCSDYHRYNT